MPGPRCSVWFGAHEAGDSAFLHACVRCATEYEQVVRRKSVAPRARSCALGALLQSAFLLQSGCGKFSVANGAGYVFSPPSDRTARLHSPSFESPFDLLACLLGSESEKEASPDAQEGALRISAHSAVASNTFHARFRI